MVIALRWQQAEGAGVLLCGLAGAWLADGPLPLWLAVLAFLAPDLSFAAYASGPRVGAFAYNITHLYGFGGVVAMAGLWSGSPLLIELGGLWLAHSGFDRLLGYGLKSPEGFATTHLGRIGRTGKGPAEP